MVDTCSNQIMRGDGNKKCSSLFIEVHPVTGYSTIVRHDALICSIAAVGATVRLHRTSPCRGLAAHSQMSTVHDAPILTRIPPTASNIMYTYMIATRGSAAPTREAGSDSSAGGEIW